MRDKDLFSASLNKMAQRRYNWESRSHSPEHQKENIGLSMEFFSSDLSWGCGEEDRGSPDVMGFTLPGSRFPKAPNAASLSILDFLAHFWNCYTVNLNSLYSTLFTRISYPLLVIQCLLTCLNSRGLAATKSGFVQSQHKQSTVLQGWFINVKFNDFNSNGIYPLQSRPEGQTLVPQKQTRLRRGHARCTH